MRNKLYTINPPDALKQNPSEYKASKEKALIRIKIIIINFFVIAAFWGRWALTTHYATDSYSCYFSNGGAAYGEIVNNYRFFMGLFTLFCDVINMNRVTYQILFGCISLLALTISISFLSFELLKHYRGKKYTWLYVNFGSLLLVSNFLMTEWFWFPECYMTWAAAVAGAIFGAIFFSREGVMNKVISALFALLMCGSYQGAMAIYVFIVMIFIFLKNNGKISKKSILQTLAAAGILGCGFVGNFLLVKIYINLKSVKDTVRLNFSPSSILGSFKNVFSMQNTIWDGGYGLFPKHLLLIMFLVLLFSIITLYLIANNFSFNTLVYMLIILFSGQFTLYLISCVQVSFWFPMRVAVPLFGVFSCSVWMITFIMELTNTIKLPFQAVLPVVCTLFIIVNCITAHQVLNEVILTNTTDKDNIMSIYDKVEEYESNTGKTVTDVSFIYRSEAQRKYDSCVRSKKYFGEICTKSFMTNWSNICSLNFYTGKKYRKVNVQPKVEDWVIECSEYKLVFNDNILFITVY